MEHIAVLLYDTSQRIHNDFDIDFTCDIFILLLK